ncbi:MAG: hypothetical protein LBM93_00795 [Oscillospiraceae bacterium]|jgi:hypothetical protein|nr:hypothetical protein [Oscillospiraceae bacterium]
MIFSACMMSLIICIADMLKPNENYDKQLKILFSLMFILSILIPISKADFNFDFKEVNSTDIQYNENLLESEIEVNIERNLSTKLKEQGLTVENLDITMNISDSGSISISKVDFSTSDDKTAENIIKANLEY